MNIINSLDYPKEIIEALAKSAYFAQKGNQIEISGCPTYENLDDYHKEEYKYIALSVVATYRSILNEYLPVQAIALNNEALPHKD